MVRVPGSTSPKGDVKVKGERDPGVAEKRGQNLEREHLKGVIRDPAARSDALDAAMDYMEVEDAKKKAEKKTEKLEISALAVHGPRNDTHDEDKRFREAEVNYFRLELAFLLQRDPLLLRNPRTLTIRDPLHAVTMLFCVLEDAGFKVHEQRISTDVREYDLETTVLTLARVYAVLQKLVPSADVSSAPLPTGDLTPPRLDDSRISFKFEDDGDALMRSTTSTKKPPPAPRRGKSAQVSNIAQTRPARGPRGRIQEAQEVATEPGRPGGVAEYLLYQFANERDEPEDVEMQPVTASPARPRIGYRSQTQPEYQGDLHDLSDDLDYDGGGGTGGRVAAVSTATRLRASAVSEPKDFSGKEHDEEAARAWFNKLSRTARASWTDLGEQFQIHFCGKGISLARKYYHMRRGSQEDPLDYLYRLNLAGIRANLKIHDGTKEQRREYVDHYIDTVQDDDLAGSLAPAPAASSRAVRVVTTGRGRRGDHGDLNEFEGESSSSNSESEDERAHVFSAARTPTPGDGEQPGARQDREDQLGRPKYGIRCSHCGSRKHTDLGCWKRLTCQKCGRMGHPTDKCFYVCKCCGDVHEAGQCKIGDFFDADRQWYNSTRHAGLLPESVEKALN
ncbi:hypothetical protein PHYSODRAFT_254061 [Phytophthora sojae]|uniref:CCHC-type domain-containing protein n=1 Tax=Phytophthora sojae (strain P6497) TaxID=1094619 RepID=G5A8V3_PHYSP|nr:hypothetical protein PHYSODRAFT_254061 [Phytophthora sojae]EGZ08329.1 hypothetical protein PHYSODRAFT_254061 [Phytophthora sojae]|eukprot:XP_009536501.1 hypothetical protein PHYSODRAFT_254061 [Phytophthora sojae]